MKRSREVKKLSDTGLFFKILDAIGNKEMTANQIARKVGKNHSVVRKILIKCFDYKPFPLLKFEMRGEHQYLSINEEVNWEEIFMDYQKIYYDRLSILKRVCGNE